MARLIIRGPQGTERDHELVDDVTTMGRGSGNIIQIKDKEASRSHCRVEKTADGHRVVDLGSRNGTKVNEVKVQNQALRHGDRITIGEFTISYDDPTAATPEDMGATVAVEPLDSKKVAAPDGKPKYVIEIVEGPDKGKTIELGAETLTIGRHSSNTYVISDESASSYHAEISREPTGHFITDLGSTNGTKVAGEKIVKTRLSPGAEITIGTTKIVFKNIGAKAEEDEVFGTVVLDTERLERELAEDEAKSRVVFLRRIGVILGVVAAVVLAVIVVLSMGGGTEIQSIEGNRLENWSFDQGVSQRGDPRGWRCIGSRYTPWQVLPDVDRLDENPTKGALVVERESEAAPDEYTECYTSVDVATDRDYTIGGWVRTDRAQGAYGLRVRWIGQGDRRSTDQAYVMGEQSKWRPVERVVSPPPWARRAEVACFAYGNRGKIYYDDVYFIPGKVSEPRSFEVRYDRVIVEPTVSGQFDVRSGVAHAVRAAGLFLVSIQEAESTQEISDPEEPQPLKSGTMFRGVIPEFIDFVSVRYEEQVRPAELGVAIEYKLRADRPLPLVRAGLRFLVTGSFGAGQMQLFDGEGKPLARRTGVVERAREIVFESPEGERLAVYLPSDRGAFNIEPRGDEQQIEVIWPGQVTIGKTPTALDVEFNTASRFERLDVDAALKQLAEARQAKDASGEHAALATLVAMADRFPKEAEQAQKELEALAGRIEADLAPVKALLAQLKVTLAGEARDTLDAQVKSRLEGLRARYPKMPFSDKVDALEQERAAAIVSFEQQAREQRAQETFDKIINFIKQENLPFARALWQQLETKFRDTEAYKKAQEHDVPGLLAALERRQIEEEAAYRRLERRTGMLVTNRMYTEALKLMESDADYQRYKDSPRFKTLYQRITALAAENPGP